MVTMVALVMVIMVVVLVVLVCVLYMLCNCEYDYIAVSLCVYVCCFWQVRLLRINFPSCCCATSLLSRVPYEHCQDAPRTGAG